MCDKLDQLDLLRDNQPPSIKTKPNWGLYRVNMIAEQSKPHSSVAEGTQLGLAGRPIIFDDFEFLAVLAGSRSSSPALKNEPNKS